MRHLRTVPVAAAISLLVALTAQVPSSGQKINLPPVTRQRLANGIRLVLMEYHKAPTLTAYAMFPGGTSVDPAGKSGTAGLMASLFTRGTQKRSATQIAEEVDFLGAALNGGASDDQVSVSLSALSKDTNTLLDLFAEVIRQPTFPAEELERERQLELNGLQSIAEDPGAVARRVNDETVYAGHPYGTEPGIASVKAITREDIQEYYRHYVGPDRMILVVAGDFTTRTMLDALKARFGDWPKGEAATITVPPVKPTPRRLVFVDKPDATQTQVRFSRTAFGRLSPDYFPAQIAEAALGGGFTSRLVDEVRVNRSLTYGIGSRFATARYGGAFQVTTFTKIETTRALLDSVRGVLQKTAAGGFSEAEIRKFKQYLAGDFAIRMQTPEALAGELADIAFYNLPDNYLETYLPRLNAVPSQEVNRIARTYFAPDRLNVVMVGPAKAVSAQIKSLGGVEFRSIDTVAR